MLSNETKSEIRRNYIRYLMQQKSYNFYPQSLKIWLSWSTDYSQYENYYANIFSHEELYGMYSKKPRLISFESWLEYTVGFQNRKAVTEYMLVNNYQIFIQLIPEKCEIDSVY